MRIHILGICGTFMGSIAILARELGHEVTGADNDVYPPMSTQLEEQGIKLITGYSPEQLEPHPDLVLIGNAMRRGNPAVEHVLNNHLPYASGPEWLAKNILQQRIVLAVAGTHGKTTTTAMLTWILQYNGKDPGFLIGGVPKNFATSATVGSDPYFVIEADEYDTAFFDKRSKFIQYHSSTLILNNIEFDHGDIFANLDAIKTQFSFLLRTIPSNGSIIYRYDDTNINEVLAKGCWTPKESFGLDPNARWRADNISADTQSFQIYFQNNNLGQVNWQLFGTHNIYNALAAIAAAHSIGISAQNAITALNSFIGVKRRLEIKGVIDEITIYDDFAHHPTAIAATIAALRAKVGQERIIAVIEFGSNTMRAGMHHEKVFTALAQADLAYVLKPQANWDLDTLISGCKIPIQICSDVDSIVKSLRQIAKPKDHILIMSNKSFGGIHKKILSGTQ